MATESYANSGDVRLSENLLGEYRLALADRASALGTGMVYYGGSFAQFGSLTAKLPILSLMGVDRMTEVAEGASTTPTSVTKSSVTITGARQAIERGQSDINEMVDTIGFNLQALAMDGLGAYAMRWQEMLCQTADFTSSVGSTGVDNDVDDVFTVKATLLNNSVPGQQMALVYPTQLSYIRDSARAESGAFQWRDDVQDLFTVSGQGVQGSFMGIQWFTSTLVESANAGVDSRGAVFALGAIGYMDGLPRHIRSKQDIEIMAGQPIWTEFERDARGALTRIIHNTVLGFQLVEQRGVDLLGTRTYA